MAYITPLIGTVVSFMPLLSKNYFASSNFTPYNLIDIIAESGRLRHKDDSSGDECGLEIVGVEQQDDGRWECEVGSLIGDTFQTATGDINLQVKRKKTTYKLYLLKLPSAKSAAFSDHWSKFCKVFDHELVSRCPRNNFVVVAIVVRG